MRPGQAFEAADVVDNYQFRPEYPAQIYDQLIALSPARDSVLDIGCGTGKIARGLSAVFRSVTAVDASRAMLRTAKDLAGDVTNITWIQGLAESAIGDTGPFDLVVAAASIHWMDHDQLLPRLGRATGRRQSAHEAAR